MACPSCRAFRGGLIRSDPNPRLYSQELWVFFSLNSKNKLNVQTFVTKKKECKHKYIIRKQYFYRFFYENNFVESFHNI